MTEQQNNEEHVHDWKPYVVAYQYDWYCATKGCDARTTHAQRHIAEPEWSGL